METDANLAEPSRDATGSVSLALDQMELSPEDIRVLAGSEPDILRTTVPARAGNGQDPFFPYASKPPIFTSPEEEATENESVAVVPPGVPDLWRETTAIREEPGKRSGGETSRRRSDVSIPRLVVILWCWIVLLGIGFAFAAGLIVGRYVLPVSDSATASRKAE